MEKTYSPHLIEQHWYKIWEDEGYFVANSKGKSYCIMLPPPNVTGSLHMGHGFNNTIMDILIRYHRMKGNNVLWQPGTDHAGIATQMVVEHQLNAEGKTRHDLGRDMFIDRVWDWKQQSGNHITKQLRRLGSSLDWSREQFTMNDNLSAAVKQAFIRLYEEGLIYRGKRLVNWDPVLHTAISDLEVSATEESGYMWHIRYPLSNASGYIIVATTRPETLLGDAAVAIHPKDQRYKHLLGEFLDLPLVGRSIPIIADEHVDPEFGTGCVKITPAHDFNDYDIWLRHRDLAVMQKLPNQGLINIFTVDATICDNKAYMQQLIPKKYIGLDRFIARNQIVADLEKANLLEKIVEHKLMVPRGDRSNSVIEPYLTNQWYVKVESLAKPAIEAVETGSIKFVPDNWKNTYFVWMRNIKDWCISRQIWWGHRIPAWYDKLGNIYVGTSESAIRKQHNLSSSYPLKQDEDVLDTWFSSALWPFSTLGWPEKTPALAQHYPTSVLVTGFDIIFFWVARMIMLGLKFCDEVPFKEVYIHGLVRDSEGQKMSKSKGNVLDPIDLIDGIDLEALVKKRLTGLMQPNMQVKIEKATRRQFADGIPAFGTDALRFTFASLATTGRDISFDLARVAGYSNFCNKLWNAARYVLINIADHDNSLDDSTDELSKIDLWIISRLNKVIITTRTAIESYRFDLAATAIYEFTWNEYCDWYLELAKITLQSDSPVAQRCTRKTLLYVLENILRLSHPIMPFITEEIWQRISPLVGIKADTIMLQPYPTTDKQINQEAINFTHWIMQFILGVRRIRGEMNISPSKALPVLLENYSHKDLELLQAGQKYLLKLGRLTSIKLLCADEVAPKSAVALIGETKILIPMLGLIDVEAEIARLEKALFKVRQTLSKITVKLNNPKFINQAPREVIAKEQKKLSELYATELSFKQQLNKIKAL